MNVHQLQQRVERLKEQRRRQEETKKLQLISPQIVPIHILTKLAHAGIHTTEEVHHYIRIAALQTLYGIGPKTEREILRYYTQNVAGA